jgi:hypothetical protein
MAGVTRRVVSTLGTGLLAAWYWYKSSKAGPSEDYITTYIDTAEAVKDTPLNSYRQIAGMMIDSFEASRLNKLAAIWTAISVVLGGLTTVAGAWPLWPFSN